jgi:endonuclease/exonuclease/phosphatase (EEP) superfamily protein YafD
MIKNVIKLIRLAFIGTLSFSIAGCFGWVDKFLELASHFRVQYLIFSLFCLLIFTIVKDAKWATLGLVVIFLNIVTILPFYWSGKSDWPTKKMYSLRVMHSNVLYANKDYTALFKLVKEENPQILVLQEFTEQWNIASSVLKSRYPYFKTVPKEKGTGIALFSQLPLQNAEAVDLGEPDRPAINVKILLGKTAVSILTLHPYTPLRTDDFQRRNKQLAAASSLIKGLPRPKVLIGDFNITPWSSYFSRMMRDAELINARNGFGVIPTWPTFNYFPQLMIPIDHCLVSPDIHVVNIRAGRHIGSDHLPLIVDLMIPEAFEDYGKL